MERKVHFTLSMILTVGLVMVGTCGYMFIEGWAFDDALYMTIITLATVGYGEVHQISDTGRLFTMILIVGGVGYFYVCGRPYRTISGRRSHTGHSREA
jgi:voltage-gated potassium channel